MTEDTMAKKTEKPKMYFVCEYKNSDWYNCYGVLSNGFCFGQHVCSHPGYAPSDLYFGREGRIKALEEIFNLKWAMEESETITVRSEKDIPVWWDEHAKLQESLKDQYEAYGKLIATL